MKNLSALCGLGLGLLFAMDSFAQMPDTVSSLNQQYRRKLDEACAPVNQWYLAELLKIYIDCRVQGNEADAEYVAHLIHSIAPETVLPELPNRTVPASEATESKPTEQAGQSEPLSPVPVPVVAESAPAASDLPVEQDVTNTTPASVEPPKLTELDRMKIILPDVSSIPVMMTYELPACDAQLNGDVRFDGKDISLWRGLDSSAHWTLSNVKPGLYEVSLLYSTSIAEPGAFEVHVGEQTLARPTIDRTGAWHKYRKCAIGRIRLPADATSLDIVKKERGGFLFNLKMVYLDEVLPEKDTVVE